MAKYVLPPDKLSWPEQRLRAVFLAVETAWILLGIGALFHLPWIVNAAAVICLGIAFRKRRPRSGPTSGIHGTAHWATREEIDQAGLLDRTEGLIVGVLPGRSSGRRRPSFIDILRVPKTDVARIRSMIGWFVNRSGATDTQLPPNLIRVPSSDKFSHTALYLPTSTGKTWRVLIPSLFADCGESCVVYDPSGETVQATAEFRRKKFGHEIRVIAPFGGCGWPPPDGQNVLDLVRPGDPGCFDLANHLAHALIVEKPDSHREPIWHAGSIMATGFMLHAILLNGSEEFRNLLSLGELLNGKRLHELAESLLDHPDLALRRRARQVLNFKGKTLDSLLATMSAELGWMDSPAFARSLAASTFSIRDLYRRPMTLYIVVPGNRAIESAPFLRVLITAILYAAFEAGPDIRRPPVRLYLDEVATIGKLDLLMSLYTQGRKYGLRSVNFFQSVGQVAEIVGSPDKIQTFRSQMSAELFKAKDLQSAKEISEWIGNTTEHTLSTSSQDGTNGGWSNSQGTHPSQGRSGGWSDSNGRTISETGVPLIRPEEILQMAGHEAIFMSAGTPPVKVNILGADDVRRCAGVAGVAGQASYLWRVRLHAAVILLCVALPGFFVGGALIWTGITKRPATTEDVGPSAWPAMETVPARNTQWTANRSPGGRSR
jgi:type IV secretion system protein VirD4